MATDDDMNNDISKRSEAQRHILAQLLNLTIIKSDLKQTVDYLAQRYQLAKDALWEWTQKTQTEFQQQKRQESTRMESTIKSSWDTTKQHTDVVKPKVIRKARNRQNDYRVSSQSMQQIISPLDYEYKEKALTELDIYSRVDCVSMINSTVVLRELYQETSDFLVKKEIIKVCRDDGIYSLAIRERDELLKIAVIRAIHNQLKTKWALDDNLAKCKQISSKEDKSNTSVEILRITDTNDEEVEKKQESSQESEEIEIAVDVSEISATLESNTEDDPVIETTAVIEIYDKEMIGKIFDLDILHKLLQTETSLKDAIQMQIAIVEYNLKTLQALERM